MRLQTPALSQSDSDYSSPTGTPSSNLLINLTLIIVASSPRSVSDRKLTSVWSCTWRDGEEKKTEKVKKMMRKRGTRQEKSSRNLS